MALNKDEYYEEKWVGRKLLYRLHPAFEWREMPYDELCDKICKLEEEVKRVRAETTYENSGLHLQRVSGSLPTKDEVVSELYARVYNGDYKKRNVMRNNMQDCYYSGYLDCFDKLTSNDR